jgi:hypothetical protein
MKKYVAFTALYFFFLQPVLAEKVLGRWSDGWYVGTVVEKINDKSKIVFDDGDQAIVQSTEIRPLNWTSGTRVQCNWKGNGSYFWATIISTSGDTISIRYDDKIEENTFVGRCREPLNNVSTPAQQQAKPPAAGKRPCVKEEFDLLVAIAANGGYEWNGTLATCTADESPGFAIYWANSPAGGVMQATLMSNPNRMQFTSGGSINLFCSKVINNLWQATGEKECRR